MDVDKILALDVPVHVMSNYIKGEVDITYRAPWHHEHLLEEKTCIVSSPVAIYVYYEVRDAFHRALCEVAPDMVFLLSHRGSSLLATQTPRKANWYLVRRALERAGIPRVHMLSYGQKSSVDYYNWLEGIPRPRQVWLDFGYRIRYSLPGNVPVMQLIRDPGSTISASSRDVSACILCSLISPMCIANRGILVPSVRCGGTE